jgi:hypothetical protein
MLPKQLENFQNLDISSVENQPKLNKIGKSSNKGNLSNFFFDFLVFTYFL